MYIVQRIKDNCVNCVLMFFHLCKLSLRLIKPFHWFSCQLVTHFSEHNYMSYKLLLLTFVKNKYVCITFSKTNCELIWVHLHLTFVHDASPVKSHLKSDLAKRATRHDIFSSNELSSQAIVDKPPFKETPRATTGGSQTRFLRLISPGFRRTFSADNFISRLLHVNFSFLYIAVILVCGW